MKALTLAALFLLAGMLSAVEIPLRNPEFKTDDKGAIPFWTAIEPKDRSGNFQSVPLDAEKGICALKISSPEGTRYYGVCQGGFDLKKFPSLNRAIIPPRLFFRNDVHIEFRFSKPDGSCGFTEEEADLEESRIFGKFGE